MKILVADDHPIFRKGLAEIVSSEFTNAQIEQAENGLIAYDMLVNTVPQVAILDVEMPERDGLQLCRDIKELNLPIKVIILTMYKSGEVFNLALNSGIDGFVLKDNSAEEIINCIYSVLDGKQYISIKMQEQLEEIASLRNEHKTISAGILSLTKSEKKVLNLVAKNMSSKEVALRLFITTKSVENYRSRICKKLGLKSENNSLLKWIIDNQELLKLIQ